MQDYKEILSKGEWIGKGDECFEVYVGDIAKCYMKLQKYNSSILDKEGLRKAFEDITGHEIYDDARILLPFRCDLGYNIFFGHNVIINYNCTFLDTVRIEVGDYTMIGPDCHIVTAIHSLNPDERKDWRIKGEPVKIGKNCWLGTNVTVLPGVTIGDDCVIGAGSVVTHDVPDGETVVGNPARPIVRHV